MGGSQWGRQSAAALRLAAMLDRNQPLISVSQEVKKLRQLTSIFANSQLNKTSDCEVHKLILTFIQHIMFKNAQRF